MCGLDGAPSAAAGSQHAAGHGVLPCDGAALWRSMLMTTRPAAPSTAMTRMARQKCLIGAPGINFRQLAIPPAPIALSRSPY